MMQIIDEDGFSEGSDIEDDTLVGHNVRILRIFDL
jgi:TATA-binding protein-associated factor Taf7